MISGNLLEAVYELNTLFIDSEVEISSFWCPFVAVPDTPSSIRLNQDYLGAIGAMIDKIKPSEEDVESEFVGKISATKANPDANSREEGEIILNYITGDEENVSKAKIILPAHEYNEACEAHKNGKNVKITGRLITSGRSKVIEKRSFTVL